MPAGEVGHRPLRGSPPAGWLSSADPSTPSSNNTSQDFPSRTEIPYGDTFRSYSQLSPTFPRLPLGSTRISLDASALAEAEGLEQDQIGWQGCNRILIQNPEKALKICTTPSDAANTTI